MMHKIKVFTSEGEYIANDYERVVYGGRGAYVEFNDLQLIRTNMYVPRKQSWRMDSPEWNNKVYYDEYRTKEGHIKVYHQKRLVDYADYKVGYWYIFNKDLLVVCENGKNIIDGRMDNASVLTKIMDLKEQYKKLG